MFKNLVKDIIKMNKNQVNWIKPIGAAICSGLPILIGLLLNQPRYGILASIGGFSYLYMFDEPYAQRIKKMFLVAVGLTITVALGIIVKPYPALVVLIVSLIGAGVTYIFGVLKIAGPGPIFFVMSFTMFTGIELSKEEIPLVILLIFIVGMFSWIMSMIGYFFNPHGVELRKVRQLYLVLDEFAEAIGRKDITRSRNKVVNVLRETEQLLTNGYKPWKNSFLFNRLVLLNEHANKLFLEMLKISVNKNEKLPTEIIDQIKKIPLAIQDNKNKNIMIKIDKINIESDLYKSLIYVLYDVEAIINIDLEYIGSSVNIFKESAWNKLIKSFNKNSIIFLYSIRYGVVLAISAIVAYKLNVVKPYWIILSCASVMCGATIASTFNRGIQRSIGTIIGIFLSVIILSIHPKGLLLVIFNMCLTVLTEITIAKNYALAAIFITPNALLIAENSTHIYNTMYFAVPRITNILIGSLIGVIGTYIISYKSASKRFNYLIAELLRSHARALVDLQYNNVKDNVDIVKEKIYMDFTNLKSTYISALGEFSKSRKKLEMLWPAIFSLEHMSYLLSQYYKNSERLSLNEDQLAELVLIYIRMASDIEQQKEIKYRKINEIDKISDLCKELNIFQEAYRMT